MIAARPWLTAVLLPAYAPDQNPTQWVWAHLKHSLANLTACTWALLGDRPGAREGPWTRPGRAGLLNADHVMFPLAAVRRRR
jgi:transposase